MASGITCTFKMLETNELLKKRGLPTSVTKHSSGSYAQQVVDSEVMRYMSPYMPLQTGMMIDSMLTHTNLGSGEVVVKTPYAKRRLKYARKNGLRGPNYFERMKVDHLHDIGRVAEKITGGKFKK